MVCAVCSAALLVGCQPPPSALPIVGTLERDRLELVAEARERIVEVLVSEGDVVEAGAILMRLDQSLYTSDLSQARATWDRAEQRVAELIRGPRSEQIDRARAELEALENTLEIARLEHNRVRALVEEHVFTEADLDRANSTVKVSMSNARAAEARLAEFLEGTTAEELGQARASVAEAAAAHGRIQLLADRLVIHAPRAGRIDAMPYKLGERPPVGATVLVMMAEGAPYARVYVPEPLRAGITPGLSSTIVVDGVDGSFAGSVRWVSADATFTPYFSLTQRDRSRLSYVAEITLTEPAARELPTGVPVEVDFPSLRPQSASGSSR
ncbi:MAG: HlyD family efflux transporter periplasmic adaptor subunit [Acidobacteria bacterium]|nr:HlyD family efflux transporter periplasmic adaptor subunit [Acidobacteriota bacterium]